MRHWPVPPTDKQKVAIIQGLRRMARGRRSDRQMVIWVDEDVIRVQMANSAPRRIVSWDKAARMVEADENRRAEKAWERMTA